MVEPRSASAAGLLSGAQTVCSIATTGPKCRVCMIAITATTAPGQMITRKHRTSWASVLTLKRTSR